MPSRTIPLVTDQIYHVFNRGVARQPIFFNQRNYQRLLLAMRYYQHEEPQMKLSKLLQLPQERRQSILQETFQAKASHQVSMVSFALMPNHFHMLLRQNSDGGITKYFKNVLDSYSKYVNTQQERVGPLFQGIFKTVRIESEEQLLHVSRYIHLNPFTSYLVPAIEDVFSYPWSSIQQYTGEAKDVWCDTKIILDHFPSPEAYRTFVSDQAEYQRTLGDIKHLLLDD